MVQHLKDRTLENDVAHVANLRVDDRNGVLAGYSEHPRTPDGADFTGTQKTDDQSENLKREQ